MAETQDVHALKEWLRGTWRQLADPSLTSFDRREIRNCMKEAETAVNAGLRRVASREVDRREAEKVLVGSRRLDFRILRLDA